MFYVYTTVLRLWRKMIQLILNKTTPHFRLLHVPMSKVDQSVLRIHEVPPLQ